MKVRDTVNEIASKEGIIFATITNNFQNDLVLTTTGMQARNIMKRDNELRDALLKIGMTRFEFALDVPVIPVAIYNVPVDVAPDGGSNCNWRPEDWAVNGHLLNKVKEEIETFNPGVRLRGDPRWIFSMSKIRAMYEDRNKPRKTFTMTILAEATEEH